MKHDDVQLMEAGQSYLLLLTKKQTGKF